jgi:hypothetical protein
MEREQHGSIDRVLVITLAVPQAAYMIPFYKLFLEGDERYRPYLYGAMRSMLNITRFESSKKQ